MSNEINEKTTVKLFDALVLLSVIATVIWYLGSLTSDTAKATLKNNEQDQWIEKHTAQELQTREDHNRILYDIDKRTIRIEEYLKHKEK